MLDVNKEILDAAYKRLAKGVMEAAGYRIMVVPLESRQGLENLELENFPTLAGIADELGEEFVTKTDDQKSKEDKASDVGILVSIGPCAFQRLRDGTVWAEEGDIIVFHRYAGHDIEHPPGSGNYFKMLNDEDIMGKIGVRDEN